MRGIHKKRLLICGLAAVLASGTAAPGALAAPPKVKVDESVYVNLDYYGKVEDVSVVKGCALNGNSVIVDYGDYRDVVNMSNGAVPKLENGKVTWDLSEEEEERFYFECKTDSLTQELPWDIDVTYKLNGRETAAEELLGASGVVTMLVDVTPNKKAPEYYRNNMVLAVSTIVDMDKDTYSLEAPGSQTQTMGTKKAVVFMAMPGEEGTFRVDIGTNNFETMGLLIAMIPATLSSLDRISDIREVKDKVRDSMDAMSDGADVILDNLSNMKGSLEETKKGIKAAQEAKATYDAGKDAVKADADAAIASLDSIRDSLTLLSAQSVIEKADFMEAMEQLDAMRKSIYSMYEYLEDLEDASKDLEDSLVDLKRKLKDAKSESSELEGLQKKVVSLIDPSSPVPAGTASPGDAANAAGIEGIGLLLGKIAGSAAPVANDSARLVHEIENLTCRAREVWNEGNALGGRMTNEYEQHVLELTDIMQGLIDEMNVTTTVTQSTLRSMRVLMDATEVSLSAAIDSSLNGMIGILDSGMGIAGGSEALRDAKDTMKNAIDDELDEIEEETNLLNIDTQEEFPSFTSDKNETPESIQIIMRTREISEEDLTDNSVDIEKKAEDIGFWGRLKALFMKIFHWFVKE